MPVSLLQGLQLLKANGAVAIIKQGEKRSIDSEIEAVADFDELYGYSNTDWALEGGRELYRLNDAQYMMFDGTHVTGIFK
jgi:hypothetical protein